MFPLRRTPLDLLSLFFTAFAFCFDSIRDTHLPSGLALAHRSGWWISATPSALPLRKISQCCTLTHGDPMPRSAQNAPPALQVLFPLWHNIG